MAQERYVTQEGFEKMKKELEDLKNVKRKQVAERLRVAAAQGDLSENFEYASAREEQDMVEGRIRELEDMLLSATVVAETANGGDAVQIGSQVTLKQGGEQFSVTITGGQEADPLAGKISSDSPLGSALLRRKKGERVQVEAPGGATEYEILDIF